MKASVSNSLVPERVTAGIAERVLVGIGATLSCEPARAHVVLLPDAVDVDVARARIERPAANLGIALGVNGELHAGHGVGELEEVVCDLRSGFDLMQRDAGADLGCLDFSQPRAAH